MAHPGVLHAALAAYAVWHPGRDTGDEPPTAEESDHMHVRDSLDGLYLSNYVQGPIHTTGRGELLGALANKPTPVHNGTDAAYVTRTITAYLPGRIVTAYKPWAMRPDGDLWELFFRAFEQIGRRPHYRPHQAQSPPRSQGCRGRPH